MKLIVENTLSDLFTDRYITYRIEKVNDVYDALKSKNYPEHLDRRGTFVSLIGLLKEVLKEMNKKYKDIYPTGEYRADVMRLNNYSDKFTKEWSPYNEDVFGDLFIREVEALFNRFEKLGYPFK